MRPVPVPLAAFKLTRASELAAGPPLAQWEPDHGSSFVARHAELIETARPPAATFGAQQRRFTAFRHEYNDERPHEALTDATPASHYTRSPRPYPARLPTIEYPGHFRVDYVSRNGGIRLGKR